MRRGTSNGPSQLPTAPRSVTAEPRDSSSAGTSSGGGGNQRSGNPRPPRQNNTGRREDRGGSSGGATAPGPSSTSGSGYGQSGSRPAASSSTSGQNGNPRGAGSGSTMRTSDVFGIIVSIKDTFGFIQPLTGGEDQIFFSLRDNGAYRDVAIGDEVSYTPKQTPKGMQAELLRPVNNASKSILRDVKGVIVREPDMHRGVPGLVEITPPEVPKGGDPAAAAAPAKDTVPFMADDVISSGGVTGSSGGGSGSPSKSSRRLVKGDEIEFVLSKITGTSYRRATQCKLVRTKRDRLQAEQVKMMLSMGAVREMGVVDSVRNDEFGFIRPTDRTEQIYFRIDDVLDPDVKVKEGTEVEFFVIAENSKGKMSDRAVHLSVLPQGTVQFEVTIAENVDAIVIDEAKITNKDEEPGTIKLLQPVQVPGKPALSTVELWPRCVPEGLVFKLGDILTLDVQYYRPEKIYFARSVRVKRYRSFGRETGVVIVVKDQGFGFVRSNVRECDLYFRLSEVLNNTPNSELMKEAEVVSGMNVLFDAVLDTGGGGGGGMPQKLRAIRVQRAPDATPATVTTAPVPAANVDLSNNPAAVASRSSTILTASGGTIALMQGCVRGLVTRDAKKDVPGLIKLAADDSRPDIGSAVSMSILYPEVVESFRDFQSTPELKEIILDSVPASMRKVYHSILDEKFPGVAHEVVTQASGIMEVARGRAMRIWKLPPAEYEIWRVHAAAVAKAAETDSMGNKLVDMRTMGYNAGSPNAANMSSMGATDEVLYLRADTYDDYGPIAKDLEVTFDLCYDKKTNKKIAKNVRLTDEPVPGYTADAFGVLDVVVTRNGRFGFVRCLPSDEKLFWHSSGAAPGTDLNDLSEGREVSFQMRKRGGLRCATSIRALAPNALNREIVLEGTCTGVVVEDNNVVLLDTTSCPQLSKKFWDISKIPQILQEKLKSQKKSGKKSDQQIWEKAAISAAGAGDGQESDVPSSAPSTSITPSVSGKGVDADLLDTVDGDSPQEQDESVRGAKYFPQLERIPLPIVVNWSDAPSANSTKSAGTVYKLGDTVQCKVVANWAMQRQPLKVFDITVTAPSPLLPSTGASTPADSTNSGRNNASGKLMKLQGTIARLKMRVRGEGSDPSSVYELCEIKENRDLSPDLAATALAGGDTTSGVQSTSVFFCDFREIRPAYETSRDSIQTGDEVEFLGIRALGVAVSVQVIPKSIKDSGITFKRAPVNAVLKTTIKNTGFRGIKMAEGPPDDGKTVGFLQGWRGDRTPDVTPLPWAHLLRHMLPPGTILASAAEFVPAKFDPSVVTPPPVPAQGTS